MERVGEGGRGWERVGEGGRGWTRRTRGGEVGRGGEATPCDRVGAESEDEGDCQKKLYRLWPNDVMPIARQVRCERLEEQPVQLVARRAGRRYEQGWGMEVV